MPQHRWRNGFGTGILVGVLSVIILALLLWDTEDQALSHCGEADKIMWGPLLGFCFELSDSVPQWAIMIFSGLASFLLLLTLFQANKTNEAAIAAAKAAMEGNNLLRSETRPWVTLNVKPECIFFEQRDGKTCKINWLYDYRNAGKSPAFRLRHEWTVCRLDVGMIAAGRIGLDRFIDARLPHSLTGITTTPVLFPGESTEHVWNDLFSHLTIEGDGEGELHILSIVTYALDSSEKEFGVEARVYKLAPLNPKSSALFDPKRQPMTHKILRHPSYDKIFTLLSI